MRRERRAPASHMMKRGQVVTGGGTEILGGRTGNERLSAMSGASTALDSDLN